MLKLGRKVRVVVGDGGTNDEDGMLSVDDVNDPPTDILLAAKVVEKNACASTVIAPLTANPVAAAVGNAGPFTYALVAGDGTNDADNGLVTIVGEHVRATGRIGVEM